MAVVGTAGWSIGSNLAHRFHADGSALQRYASVFDGVEINSSFYRRHKRETWQRWADSVSESFRFAVKLPRAVSHELRLVDAGDALTLFMADIEPLGPKLGPLLLQMPPTLRFDAAIAGHFIEQLRQHYSGIVVVEPRHLSWASVEASALLDAFGVWLVAADPSLPQLAAAAERADFVYLRMHGAPRTYYSSYDRDAIDRLAVMLAQPAARHSWCIFDNTASGAALVNSLELRDALRAVDAKSANAAGQRPGKQI